MTRYDDIIDLPRPVSKKHPPMPLSDRAAQFSPFAALTGYGDAVNEHARPTDERIAPDESALYELDIKLGTLLAHISELPELTVTFFVQDEKKSGGAYVEKSGRLRRLDRDLRSLIMDDGAMIPICDVYELDSPLFGREEDPD